MDVSAEFDFEIKYLPGEENTLADSLSRIYSNDAPETVRAQSELIVESSNLNGAMATRPLYTGQEALLWCYLICKGTSYVKKCAEELNSYIFLMGIFLVVQ